MRALGWRLYWSLLLGRPEDGGHALARLSLCRGQHVLVLGGAAYELVPMIAALVGAEGSVRVLEAGWPLLMQAWRYVRACGVPEVSFGQWEADRICGAGANYDLIYCVTAPESWERLLAGAWRALRPGGVLCVMQRWPGARGIWRARLVRLAGSVGFRAGRAWGWPWHYTAHLRKPDADALHLE